METVAEIKYWLNSILSPISCILNLILFYLIKNHSSKNLQNYKKVLYLGWFTDFIFAFWNVLFSPDTKVIGGVYFILSNGFLGHISSPFNEWLFLGSVFLMYFSVVNVAVQFAYRYLLLCWKKTLNLVIFLLLVLLGVISILFYLYFFVNHLITRTPGNEKFAYLLNDSDWLENGKIPPFGTFEVVAFANALYLSFSVTIASCLVVIICGIAIFRKILIDSEQLSNSVKLYQRQITIVMTVEAIVPFVTIAFPILLDITTIMFGFYIPWAGKIAFLIGCFSPVINPIVKMGVVSCYRKQLLKMLHLKKYFSTTTVVQTLSKTTMT